jgi:uncharacterized protein YfaS (alpha-2-macroglobulin family)
MQRLLISFILLLAVHSLKAQPGMNDYKELWKKAEKAEEKGLTKTAGEEVTKIYAQAVKENNYPQVIKAATYRIRYRNMVEEESQKTNFFFMDTLIKDTRAPARNILQSMQAEMLWSFLQQNRWRFYNRTQLAEEKGTDITTWSIAKLHQTIAGLHLKSLENEALLKQTKIEEYEAIIIKGENTRHLRPTLYDVIANRALDYFKNDERDIAKPAYAFKISQTDAFAPAADFTKAKFSTKDTASFHYKALLLYKDLLAFHLNDAKPDALIDADIDRLEFVNQHSTLNDKEKLYEAALKNIETRYGQYAATAQAGYLRGQLYYSRGQGYDPLSKTDNQYEIKRAKELFESIVAKYPKCEGAVNATNMLNSIKQRSLNFETELVNVPGQHFRTLVSYKNIPQLYFRLMKTTREDIKKYDRRDYEKVWNDYTALTPMKSWKVTLPDPGDFQIHHIEIKNDALEPGTYILLASADEKFSLAKNILAKDIIYVSNISYIQKGEEYHVLHRETGQPLANANVQVYELKYNYNNYKEEEIKAEKYTSNDNGYFKLKRTKDSRNIVFDITHGKERLFLDNRHYSYAEFDENGNPIVNKDQAFLFTDRSIYRPGQTVYFKGIVVSRKDKPFKAEVVAGKKVTVQLKDANWQKQAELTLTTNEFGSYNGSFRLPEGLLNGQFTIWDSAHEQNHAFSVEEYKRPKFMVEIKQPKGSYRVNDSIKVTGTAKAYAGNNIDGAKVKYRIVRKIQWPWWWDYGYSRYSRWNPRPGGREQMEITNGEATTNEKGEFTVTFKAIPDESVKKEDQPTFQYELTADITDINGETRSGNITVPVAYQALQLNIEVASQLTADSLNKIGIGSTNINGSFEKADVNISIHRLKNPGRFFRERLWRQPDQFLMSRDEYYTLFPYDVYKDEDQTVKWEKGDRALDARHTTAENEKYKITNTKFAPGWYVIEVTAKDKYGENVKALKYIELIPGNGQLAANTPLAINAAKTTAEPGEKINYTVGTTFKDVFLIHQQQFMYGKQNMVYERLSNSSKSSDLTLTENDRGGVGANASFVKYNRVFGNGLQFNVPWSNKELKIEFESFRDKTLPGSKEEYKLKISGLKGDKVAAEMLAAMYDASLDQFQPHGWFSPGLFPNLYAPGAWNGNDNFKGSSSEEKNDYYRQNEYFSKSYDRLLGGGYYDEVVVTGYGMRSRAMKSAPQAGAPPPAPEAAMADGMVYKNESAKEKEQKSEVAGAISADDMNAARGNKFQEKPKQADAPVQIRKNFNETAFFLPNLKTDANGNVIISYTIPEALTEWKLMAFAHTKDMATAIAEKKVVTQKPIMVQPNAPRFLREGDKLELVTKVVNLTDKEVTGTAELQLIDPSTNTPVDGWFKNIFPNQYFTVPAGQSSPVAFTMEIPFNYNRPLTYRIIAKTKPAAGADAASDGEENMLPVVTNRMLVTETMPLPMRGNGTKNFKFEKLIGSASSPTLGHQAITVEYTSNPAWYAVQALPYLMEYPYECAEQTFNRFYANALAGKIANSSPKIKAVFEKWKNIDKEALLSNLQKNEELKSALLQETPWVLDAKNEEQQKKNIGLLFDMMKMSGELDKAMKKLQDMQSSNGGFVWFKGGPDDRYITQYIITGMGHLKKLGAIPAKQEANIKEMLQKALPYLDMKLKQDYDDLIRYKAKLKDNNTGYMQINYHYMRSFFPESTVAKASETAYNYYRQQMQQYWLQNSKYMQGMIALALHRTGDTKTPAAVLKSLKENAIVKEEMGMYWKDVTGGYYWHQAPIETMALMIEAFSEAGKDTKAVDDLKTWLLKNKQTMNWKTTKATAEACYALLLEGSDWLSETPVVEIKLGNTTISSATAGGAQEGTGYFKQRIEGEKVKPEMGNISVTVSNTNAKAPTSTWGGVYWQYFENLDKITSAETPLKLQKKLFIETMGDRGPVLKAVNQGDIIKVGDKIKVRIELRVDRDMEYVHMKDMRSSGTEPVNVLSEYKWQGGLGYYETTKDASTNFFFGWLPKGTYVFEYPVFVTHKGDFSNGITTIQCMYAPEFTSHSEGVRVRVD